MLLWDSTLSVNDATLDDQHRQFVDMINAFEQAGLEGKSPEVVGNVLQFLVRLRQEALSG